MEEQLNYLKHKITKAKAHIASSLLKETSLFHIFANFEPDVI